MWACHGDVRWLPLQVATVALCFLLNMLDGADLLVMSFIAPVLSGEWGIAPENLGIIFSASLAGMAGGCLFLAPLADRFGRRPTDPCRACACHLQHARLLAGEQRCGPRRRAVLRRPRRRHDRRDNDRYGGRVRPSKVPELRGRVCPGRMANGFDHHGLCYRLGSARIRLARRSSCWSAGSAWLCSSSPSW